MSATDAAARTRLLCVAVHDVAPATWDDCRRLHDAVRAVADIPLSWLVVPRYHGQARRSAAMEGTLDALRARGHELVLHGYTHLDETNVRGVAQRWLRTVYTRGEGEFAALDEAEAGRRLALGAAWFAARGWPLAGFVAPAWLLGAESWRAVAAMPFAYTTTLTRFHLLASGHALWAPSLVYTARNRAGRLLSPPALSLAARLHARAPLLRLALHPADARHPALLRHMQGLLASLLARRTAVTKADCAAWLTSTDPTCPRHASAPDRSPHSSRSRARAATLPWR